MEYWLSWFVIKKVLRFSISRNGGTLAQLQKGTMKEPQSVWISPFRIAANPLKRQLLYSIVRQIPLSHQRSGDALSGGEQFFVMLGTDVSVHIYFDSV